MFRQDLRQHQIDVLLEQTFETGERITMEAIADKMVEAKLIENSEDDYRQIRIEKARREVHRYRQAKAKAKKTREEPVNLFAINEDGVKVPYWKVCGQLDPNESAQHLRYWRAKSEQDVAKFARYYKFHIGRHKKKLQRLLDFGPPVLT